MGSKNCALQKIIIHHMELEKQGEYHMDEVSRAYYWDREHGYIQLSIIIDWQKR